MCFFLGTHCGGRRCALPPAPPHPLLFFNRLPLLPTLFVFYSYVFPVVFFDPPFPQFLDDFHYDRPYSFFCWSLFVFFLSPRFCFFLILICFFFDPLAGFGSFFENQKKVSCWHRLPWGHGPQVSSGRCCKKVTTRSLVLCSFGRGSCTGRLTKSWRIQAAKSSVMGHKTNQPGIKWIKVV